MQQSALEQKQAPRLSRGSWLISTGLTVPQPDLRVQMSASLLMLTAGRDGYKSEGTPSAHGQNLNSEEMARGSRLISTTVCLESSDFRFQIGRDAR